MNEKDKNSGIAVFPIDKLPDDMSIEDFCKAWVSLDKGVIRLVETYGEVLPPANDSDTSAEE